MPIKIKEDEKNDYFIYPTEKWQEKQLSIKSIDGFSIQENLFYVTIAKE